MSTSTSRWRSLFSSARNVFKRPHSGLDLFAPGTTNSSVQVTGTPASADVEQAEHSGLHVQHPMVLGLPPILGPTVEGLGVPPDTLELWNREPAVREPTMIGLISSSFMQLNSYLSLDFFI